QQQRDGLQDRLLIQPGLPVAPVGHRAGGNYAVRRFRPQVQHALLLPHPRDRADRRRRLDRFLQLVGRDGGHAGAPRPPPDTFAVTVTDADGHSTPAYVDVPVVSTLARIDVLPKTPQVKAGGKLHFIAFGKDQFGGDLSSTTFTWSTTGGKIDAATGEFTAPS